MTEALDKLVSEAGFTGWVKRKSNNTGKLKSTPNQTKQRASRFASGSPEVVVKISSFGKGGKHAKAHLTYISRNGQLDMENERGETFDSKESIRDLHGDWMRDIDTYSRGKNSRDTMHVILSCPAHDHQKLKDAAREFAKEIFSNFEYVFVLHEDTDNPHVHLSVKMRGFDGKKLQVVLGDPQIWRENFAESLRKRGIDAEATGRIIRGVSQKAENQVIRHIDAKTTTRPERVSKVRAAKIQQAVAELKAENDGKVIPQNEWDIKLKESNKKIRADILLAARSLRKLQWKIKDVNKQVLNNDRPNYNTISDANRKAQRVAATLYKPSLGVDRSQPTPKSFARLRDVPPRHVDGARVSPKVLLQPHAHLQLGRGISTGDEMRRQGAGADADGARGLGGVSLSVPLGDIQLANLLRDRARSMPAPVTANKMLKIKLRLLGRVLLQGEATVEPPEAQKDVDGAKVSEHHQASGKSQDRG